MIAQHVPIFKISDLVYTFIPASVELDQKIVGIMHFIQMRIQYIFNYYSNPNFELSISNLELCALE